MPAKKRGVASAQPAELPKRPPKRKAGAGSGKINWAVAVPVAVAAVAVVLSVATFYDISTTGDSSPGAQEHSRKARRPSPPPISAPLNERRDNSESLVSLNPRLFHHHHGGTWYHGPTHELTPHPHRRHVSLTTLPAKSNVSSSPSPHTTAAAAAAATTTTPPPPPPPPPPPHHHPLPPVCLSITGCRKGAAALWLQL